jgi:hypothetical protein
MRKALLLACFSLCEVNNDSQTNFILTGKDEPWYIRFISSRPKQKAATEKKQ